MSNLNQNQTQTSKLNSQNTSPNTDASIKVRGDTDPVALSGAVAGIIREFGHADLFVIGAAAVNQAVKGVAIARSYFISQGKDLHLVPAFKDIQMDNGESRTALQLKVVCLSV